jgi:hypothetical protein
MAKNKKGKQKQDEPAVSNNQIQPSTVEQVKAPVVPGRYFTIITHPLSTYTV